MRPCPPATEAHDVWIKFLQERIEVAKYCSQDQIEMYCDMLQRTLDIHVSGQLYIIRWKEGRCKYSLFSGWSGCWSYVKTCFCCWDKIPLAELWNVSSSR